MGGHLASLAAGVNFSGMGKTVAIDDLPGSQSVSRLRASGVITAGTAVTTVSFGDQSFNVAVSHRRFPNGGSWSFFVCPCGRRCRILCRIQAGLRGRWCLSARGMRGRVRVDSDVCAGGSRRSQADCPADFPPRRLGFILGLVGFWTGGRIGVCVAAQFDCCAGA